MKFKNNAPVLLPLTAVMALSVLGGCGKKEEADTSSTPAATAPSTTPPGPAAGAPGSVPGTNPDTSTPGTTPGGPGGTMNNKASQNPHGGAAGDGLISLKVKNALIADKTVAATSINVDTKSGSVVLRGSQKTAAAVKAAVADAQKISGVHDVMNQLTVKP